MAKIRIVGELIISQLFPGEDIKINGATYDPILDLFTLDIAGPNVPPVELVKVEVTRQPSLVFKFVASA